MTAAEVDALEASLKRTPEDFDTLRKLQIFYQWSGQKVFGWNEMIARRRPHLLWLIEDYPEHELAMWQVNAAYFLEKADPQLAEQMLLRAKAMATDSNRARAASEQLGNFYGNVILGPTDPRDGAPRTRIDSERYAREVRQRLAESNDAVLLGAAGGRLVQTYRDEDRRQLGRQLLERALQIDPQQQYARRVLTTVDVQERSRQLRDKVRHRAAVLAGGQITANLIARHPLTPDERAMMSEAEPRAVSELSEYEQFILLPELAAMAYMGAESFDWNKNKPAAELSFARSKKYAQEALALAPKFRNDPDYGRVVYHATVALALHALREGGTGDAVRRMREAVDIPTSRGLEGYSVGLDYRLVNYLLKAGERDTVAEFLEGSAALRPAERERLLKDAAAIRAGTMPMSFQYMVSR